MGYFKNTLKRGSKQITNILSSFGSIRETNISAMLGYLIHVNPIIAAKLFGVELPLKSVNLELRSDLGQDRYDIVITSSTKTIVVEVKIANHSPEQLRRYSESGKKLFSIGSRLQRHLIDRSFHKNFVDWEMVCATLNNVKLKGTQSDQFYNKLADDFCLHLKENNMIRDSLEDVYTRDLSGTSVDMYFTQHIYKCQAKYYEKAKNSRYFAPYFTGANGKNASTLVKSLGIGISFVSKINSSALASEKEIYGALKTLNYSNRDISLIFDAFKWKPNSSREHTILFLDEPLRLFQRPVTKYDFWEIPGGAMPSMSIDFGDLIAASNGLFPLSKRSRNRRRSKK